MGYFNPTGAPHSPHPKSDHADHHAGDLPNLTLDLSNGTLTATTSNLALDPTAKTLCDGDGSAIVIHAAVDDFTSQPSGASGARVACGVISQD
jgi:Cu-Zn family superoxide dismutase